MFLTVDPCAKSPCTKEELCRVKSPSTHDCICNAKKKMCVQRLFSVNSKPGFGLNFPTRPKTPQIPQRPVPTPQPGAQPPKKIPNINPIFPSPTLSSLKENYPVRRKFPRTWIWEEINMRFTYMNYLLQYL